MSLSKRRCYPQHVRPWTAGLSVCCRLDAAVRRAIRSPAAGSPLPVAELSTSECRCHPLDVWPWTAGLSVCPPRDAAVSRCHLVPPNTQPVRCTPYRLGPEKTRVLRQQLDKLLQLGIVEKSDSQFALPVILVPKFAIAEVDYLGHHVGLEHVQPRAKKVEALLSYPTPVNRKQLQSFLGLAGYYRKFVPHYAHIAAALSDLLKKGTRFVWTPVADKAFLDLKSRLSTCPVLRPPDYSLPFCMSVDASDVATGSVLFETVEGIDRLICFCSKKLDSHQRHHSTIEKEVLSLVLSVRVFSVYFESSPIKVYTDHNPLIFLQRMAPHNQKLLRWSLEIHQYNLEILHRSGKDNLLPDLLSRTPDNAN